MPTTISLRPIQTGDACYLTDHHTRDGECIVTVTMMDGAATTQAAEEQLLSAMHADDRVPYGERGAAMDDLASVAAWCAAQWQAAQADMPAEQDRDSEGADEARYLECHILATWEG